jgi:5'(3')-deoxyribonucleotidase
MSKIAALDIDGVLADFCVAACLAHRRVNPYVPVFGDPPLEFDMDKLWGMSLEEFWKPLSSHNFWANLGWTKDGLEILKIVEAEFGATNVYLLSKPCDSPESASGKLEWIQKKLPDYANRYLLGPAKDFAAHTGAVLIDDNDVNINTWRKRGGIGVLVPRPWNSAHDRQYKTSTLGIEIAEAASACERLTSYPDPSISPTPPNASVRTFETGANRDLDDNKLDFEGFLSPLVIEEYGKYMHKNRRLKDGSIRASDNWQNHFGKQHYSVCIKSMWRHFHDLWMEHRGFKSREGVSDALMGIIFNVMAYADKFYKDKKKD